MTGEVGVCVACIHDQADDYCGGAASPPFVMITLEEKYFCIPASRWDNNGRLLVTPNCALKYYLKFVRLFTQSIPAET